MSGHSCPTVAGAYLMTLKGLKVLYDDSIPVRGDIKVEFKSNIKDGVVGVISNVVSNITRACADSGFKGLNGNFSRNNLMSFGNSNINGIIRLTRIDTDDFVDVDYNADVVFPNSKLNLLMSKAMQNLANKEELIEFKELWQDRVKRILIDNFDNENMVIIKK